tara:strand:- start:2344 stop:3255 length:912 start_codon:yes stop_codon:yes gene_type:complete
MKDMIQQMTNIEDQAKAKKQKINESASMNISMTADDAGQVGQLMSMMKNAGMNAKPVASDMPMPMRKDIDKFRAAVGPKYDNPSIPGKDDVPGDMDLKAGIGKALTTLGTAGIGGALGGPAGLVGGALVGQSLGDDVENEGDYANSPDEDYAPYTDVIKSGNDLNKSKKSYPKVAGGDNPMNLADKIKEELAGLYKEYQVPEGHFGKEHGEIGDQLFVFAQEIKDGKHRYDYILDELNSMFDMVKKSGDKVYINAFKALRGIEPEDVGDDADGGMNQSMSKAQDAIDILDGADDSDYPHMGKM